MVILYGRQLDLFQFLRLNIVLFVCLFESSSIHTLMKGKQITFSAKKNLHYISLSLSLCLSLSLLYIHTRTHTTNSRSAFNSANSKISAHHWESGRKIERPSGRECLCARERERERVNHCQSRLQFIGCVMLSLSVHLRVLPLVRDTPVALSCLLVVVYL